jgi:chromosome segregation ATPase
MTELERILKETLDAQTRELGERLDRHQERLDIQNREIMEAKLKLAELRQRQEESERHLMRLSSVYDGLKPLLEKLNSFLSAR